MALVPVVSLALNHRQMAAIPLGSGTTTATKCQGDRFISFPEGSALTFPAGQDVWAYSDLYLADLAFYANVKVAAKRGVSGADTIYSDLKVRFNGKATGPAAPITP